MNKQNWTYTYNTFEINTRDSSKKMNILAADHFSKLQASEANPAIALIVAETEAYVLAFALAYMKWSASIGIYKGETNRFTNLLAELSNTKIKQWDNVISNEFIQGSSDYIAILPNGRGPFQGGAYDIRISEVASLAERLLPYIDLADLRTEVLAHYTVLLAARNVQQQKEGKVKNESEALNVARLDLADQMYKNLASLMVIFYKNPVEIERFFDLELLRNNTTETDEEAMEIIEGTVDVGEFKNVLNGNFTPTSLISINNTGTVPLVFYLANTPDIDAQPPTVGIIIMPGSTSVYSALEFGAIFTAFLNVKTDSITVAGSYQVTLT